MPFDEKAAGQFLDARYGEDAQSDVRASVMEGMTSNPDRAATALRYSHEMGIPLDMAERRLDELEKESAFSSIDYARLQKSPMLMDFMRDRDNARLAHDDIGGLMQVSDWFRSFGGGGVESVGMAISGAGRVVQRSGQAVADRYIVPENPLDRFLSSTAIGTYQFAGDVMRFSGESWKKVGRAIMPPQERMGFMDYLGQGLGQVSAQIAAAIATGGTSAGVGLATLQMADMGYEEAERQGETGWKADATAALYAGITGLTEKYGLEYVMKGIPEPLKRGVTKKIAEYAARLGLKADGLMASAAVKTTDTAFRATSEATQEATEQLLQNIVDIEVLGDDKSAFEGVGQSGQVGGGVGAIVGAIANLMIRGHTDFNIEQEQSVVRELQESRRIVQIPKLFGRAPRKLNELLRREMGDTMLYLNPVAVDTFYQSLTPEGRDQLNESVPEFAEKLEEARTEGADFVVNRADYHTYVQPLDEQGFLDQYARFVPEDMSPGDRAEYDAQIAELYDLVDDVEQGLEDGEIVQENFYRQLLQRFGERIAPSGKVDVARLLAENPRVFYETMLQRSAGDERVKEILDRLVRDVEVNRVIPNLGQFIRRDDFDLQIDRVRNERKASRKAAQKPAGKDLLGEKPKRKAREKRGPAPVLDFIASRGVVPGSRAALDLAALDITPKTYPKVFRKSGSLKSLDGISFDEISAAVPQAAFAAEAIGAADTDGYYVSPDDIVEAIRDELLGKGARTDEEMAAEQEAEYLDQLGDAIDMAGVDLESASNAEVKAALQRAYDLERAAMQAAGETFQQAALVESEAFKAWFSDSKVVDENGDPLVVYHGTVADFGYFRPFSHFGNKDAANEILDPYMDERHSQKFSPRIMPVYLSIRNPVRIADSATPHSIEDLAIEAENADILQLDDDGNSRIDYILEPTDEMERAGRLADEMLKAGYDGFVYENLVEGAGNDSYIIVDPTQVKSVFNQGTYDPYATGILYQDEQSPRGSITFTPEGKAVINLFEKEDLSTVLHEMGHLYWKAMTEIAALDNAPVDIAADVAAMRAWVGASGDAALTIEQEEMIADGFLAYLRAGETPSAEMAGAFARFKGWLTRLYRGVRDTLPKINPEVKGIFDRMLATDEAIEEMAGQQEFTIDQRIMNMLTKADAERMRKKFDKAVQEAKEKLFRKAMRQSERRNTKAWREARAALVKEVRADMEDSRPYQTIEAIKRAGGLSRKALVKSRGKEIIPYFSGHGGLIARSGGAAPEDIAALAGYGSEREMIDELINTKPIKQATETRVDELMLQRYGDMLRDGTIEREAMEAYHSALRAEIMQMEMDMLAELAGIPAPTKEGLKAKAVEMMAAKKVREISPSRHLRAEKKAYFDYGQALGKKDYAKAAEAKARQILNHHLYKMSVDARATIDKKLRGWRRILSKSDKKIGEARRLDIDYVYAARAILAKHGMGREDYDFSAWYRMLESENPDLAEALSFAIGMYSEEAKPYKEMEWSDFLALGDAVDNLIEVGKGQRYITVEGKKVEITEAVDRLSAQALVHSRTGLPSGFAGKLTDRDISKIGLYGVKAKWRRVESWIRAVDGDDFGGPFRELIWNRVKDATTAYKSERDAWMKRMVDILAPHKDRLHGEKIMAYELVSEKTGEFYTFEDKGELIGMMAHLGNGFEAGSNGYKLLEGMGWDADSFDAFMQRMYDEGMITKEDWDLVQELWNLAEDLKPSVWRVHKEMYGFRPKEVTAVAVSTPFGSYKGGYWPAIADRTKSDDAARRADNEAISKQNNFTVFPSTGRGATKSRVDNYAAPLEMSLRLLPSHVDWALRFIHIEPAVKDAGKIMINKDFRAVMKEIDPVAVQEMLVPWLQRAARQTLDMPKPGKGWKWINDRAAWLRRQAGLQIMAGNVVNTLQQVTGLAPSIYKVGARHFAKAWVQFFSDMPGQSALINEASAAMKFRTAIIDQNYMQRVSRMIERRGKYRKVADFTEDHGYILQHVAQGFVDKVTWLAAYNKALEGDVKGINAMDDTAAIRYADSIVRETQGSMDAEDVSDIEAQTALGRLFTIFYSFFSAQGNLLLTEGQRIKRSDAGIVMKSADVFMLYTMVYLIPSFFADIISAALRGRLPDDDDEDGTALDEWLGFYFISQARYAAAMLPYAGQAANAVIGQFTEQQYDDHITLSPAVGLTESIVRMPKSVLSAMFDDGDKSRAVGDVMQTIGALARVPTAPLRRPVTYAVNVAEGDEEPPGGLPSTLRGVLGGPGASK